MNDHRQDQPHSVYHDVTLAPHDLFAGIVSIDPPLFVCLRRLTVDARRARLLVSARCSANPSTKGVVDPLQSSVTGPRSKVIVDCPRRRKVVGQESPGASRSQQVEDRVEHLADVRGARPAAEFGCGQERFDNHPLLSERSLSYRFRVVRSSMIGLRPCSMSDCLLRRLWSNQEICPDHPSFQTPS